MPSILDELRTYIIIHRICGKNALTKILALFNCSLLARNSGWGVWLQKLDFWQCYCYNLTFRIHVLSGFVYEKNVAALNAAHRLVTWTRKWKQYIVLTRNRTHNRCVHSYIKFYISNSKYLHNKYLLFLCPFLSYYKNIIKVIL